jgi:ABC-type uncharacterized transport system permease subunit
MHIFYDFLNWFTAASYLLISVLLFFDKTNKNFLFKVFVLSVVLLLHGLILVIPWFKNEILTFGFSTAFTWMLWLASIFILVEASFRGILPSVAKSIFFLSAISLILPLYFPPPELNINLSLNFRLHILIAMLSYSSFVFSALQAITVLIQEKALRVLNSRQPSLALPSLLELDASLFRILLITLFLLSATLISGVFVNLELGNDILIFDHKTLFSFMAWSLIVFVIVGRFLLGWRGRLVARLTIIGFILIFLAYIGTQFVIEVLV